MKNINMLFENNDQYAYKINIIKGSIVFQGYDNKFSGNTILKIINFINTVHKKYKNSKITIVFLFKEIEIVDKLSYILFECICYYLMKNCHHKVYLYWNPQDSILTRGIFLSPLKYLNNNKNNLDIFLQKFEKDIYQRHFRRLISNDKETTNYLGNLLQELDSFLKFFSITEEYRDQISEVITELTGNACEHGCTDCLLDIDITASYKKSIEGIRQKGNFYGINIAIVNFSNILLGDGIKAKIDSGNLNEPRYIDLRNAYNYHKTFFTEDYTYFCNLSSLQDKISGRTDYGPSGGTGLTKLIHSLQKISDVDKCYVISGHRGVFFLKNVLNYDDRNWLGFNEEKDFFHATPKNDVTTECYIFFPGTAYNLNFVMKREDDYNDHN